MVWAPQPGPQQALIACPCKDVLYGGARGGGKTDGMLGDFGIHSDQYRKDAKGVFFRHTLTQLEEAIARSQDIYGPLGARWRDSAKVWEFRGGGILKFRYLERLGDADNYQGHQYTRLYFEELTNWADPRPINRLNGTLRSAKGVPTARRGTGNPGGVGHAWVKAKYIDPSPLGFRVWRDEKTNWSTTFIPAKVKDNLKLMENDPTYIDTLRGVGSEELVKAWLDGNWDVIEGAYFHEFQREMHVVRPFKIPQSWIKFVAMDWGSARPCSVGWYAVADGTTVHTPSGPFTPPRGALIRYREFYICSEAPGVVNTGLRLSASVVASAIINKCQPDLVDGKLPYKYFVADPAIFIENGGPSIAEMMTRESKIVWTPADNKRLPGWNQVRTRLIGYDGRPMVYLFDSNRHLIRTLPLLQHDENDMEDLDTEAEDHAADELRYACMSRPWAAPLPASTKKPRGPQTFDEMINHLESQQPTGRRRI